MLTERWIQLMLQASRVTEELPFSQRFRESWAKSTVEHQVLFWLMLAGLVGSICFLAIVHRFQQRKLRSKPIVNDPELLFENLLNQIELADADKHLLRQMVANTRLTNPSLCLLSPGLLQWTCRLWLTEKGKQMEPETLQRIETISVKLYDHAVPSVN